MLGGGAKRFKEDKEVQPRVSGRSSPRQREEPQSPIRGNYPDKPSAITQQFHPPTTKPPPPISTDRYITLPFSNLLLLLQPAALNEEMKDD